ncbi:MAG: hypothetical protein ACE5F1_07445 [Planctomycetota bacterium]
MQRPAPALAAFCLAVSPLLAQRQLVEGEQPPTRLQTGAPVPPVASTAAGGGSIGIPQGAPVIVPAAQATAFGNSNNNIPFSWTPTRYQQVFLGSELPATHIIQTVALRQDDRFAAFSGAIIDVEIKIGYTTFTQNTVTSSFAGNFNSGTPARVLARRCILVPNMPPTRPTNPALFFFRICLDRPFPWVRQTGRNLLIEVVVWGNSRGNAIYTFPLDAASGTTTSRIYASGNPTASTGTVSRGFGMVFEFDTVGCKNKNPGCYRTFGKGCPGTGGFVGHIAPSAARTEWGNTANAWTFGSGPQRWQQEINASEMPRIPTRIITYAQRDDEVARTSPASTITIQMKFGMTSKNNATMTSNYATNADRTQTTVFKTANVNLPAVSGGNKSLQKFVYVVKLDQPYLYVPKAGENFLIEIVNTTATRVGRWPDAFSGAKAQGSRVYANNCPTCTTGTLGLNHCMAIGFGTGGTRGSAIPVLGATGRPILGKTFDVKVSGAKPTTAAVLVIGVSNTAWGKTPLPFSLAPFNAPGCNLLVSYDLLKGTAVDANGNGKVTLPVPNLPVFLGQRIHNQYFVVDLAANGMGLAWSNGGTATLGDI